MPGTTPKALAEKVFTQDEDATPAVALLGKFNIMVVDSDNALNATVVLEISINGGTTWYIVETYTDTQTVKVGENYDPRALFRLRVDAFTSATAGYMALAQI
ncbi:MAG TPA: hypothetical protein VEC14_10455 [Reyranellaceae bacterium]|nr:hypothetical protein [Reyranellaceae bacterium]